LFFNVNLCKLYFLEKRGFETGIKMVSLVVKLLKADEKVIKIVFLFVIYKKIFFVIVMV